MQIAMMLKIIGNLSLGNDNITPVEQAIFLQYLNLAHLELYQLTANFNQDLLSNVTVANTQNTNQFQLPEVPYLVNNVYDLTNKKAIDRISLTEAIANDPAFTNTGLPTHYYIQGNVLELVPKQTSTISLSIWYVPQAIHLTEITQEQDIPYPLTYHPILMDGALYYLFQEEGGFKNAQKAQDAANRWESGKSRLIAYFYNFKNRFFSTFSNV
jgi:hypothetical protein